MKNPLPVLLLAVLAALLLFAGCLARGQSLPPEPRESAVASGAWPLAISARNKFRCPVEAHDLFYVGPTKAQIPSLLKYCDDRRTKMYRKEVFDCDDITREYRVNAAKWCAAEWPDGEYALAIATVLVEITGTVDEFPGLTPCLHAMIALRRADGQWIFIEPALGKWCGVEGPLLEGAIEVMKVEL